MTRLLVVGLGRQGVRHARVATSCPDVELVGTVDPFAPGTAQAPHFDKLDQAMAAVDVDAAIVAAPTQEHFRAVGDLLERGVPTLVEKPLCAEVEDAEELVALARSRGVLLAVGHVERFNPAVAMVAAMLRKGSLGRPIDISFRRVGLPPASLSDVNVVHDLAVHDIDVFRLLSGGPPRLVGASGWPRGGVVESAHLLLETRGVHGSVRVNWRTPVRLRDFSVTTDTCYVEANYTTQRVEVVQPPDHRDFVEFSEFQSHYGSARRVQLEPRPAEPLAAQLEAFVAAVAGEDGDARLPRPPLATGQDGLEALRIADQATRWVRWP